MGHSSRVIGVISLEAMLDSAFRFKEQGAYWVLSGVIVEKSQYRIDREQRFCVIA